MWVFQQATYCLLNLLVFMVWHVFVVLFNCIHQFVPLCHSYLNSTSDTSECSMTCVFFRHQSHVLCQSFHLICLPALEPQHSHSTGLPILSQVWQKRAPLMGAMICQRVTFMGGIVYTIHLFAGDITNFICLHRGWKMGTSTQRK